MSASKGSGQDSRGSEGAPPATPVSSAGAGVAALASPSPAFLAGIIGKGRGTFARLASTNSIKAFASPGAAVALEDAPKAGTPQKKWAVDRLISSPTANILTPSQIPPIQLIEEESEKENAARQALYEAHYVMMNKIMSIISYSPDVHPAKLHAEIILKSMNLQNGFPEEFLNNLRIKWEDNNNAVEDLEKRENGTKNIEKAWNFLDSFKEGNYEPEMKMVLKKGSASRDSSYTLTKKEKDQLEASLKLPEDAIKGDVQVALGILSTAWDEIEKEAAKIVEFKLWKARRRHKIGILKLEQTCLPSKYSEEIPGLPLDHSEFFRDAYTYTLPKAAAKLNFILSDIVKKGKFDKYRDSIIPVIDKLTANELLLVDGSRRSFIDSPLIGNNIKGRDDAGDFKSLYNNIIAITVHFWPKPEGEDLTLNDLKKNLEQALITLFPSLSADEKVVVRDSVYAQYKGFIIKDGENQLIEIEKQLSGLNKELQELQELQKLKENLATLKELKKFEELKELKEKLKSLTFSQQIIFETLEGTMGVCNKKIEIITEGKAKIEETLEKIRSNQEATITISLDNIPIETRVLGEGRQETTRNIALVTIKCIQGMAMERVQEKIGKLDCSKDLEKAEVLITERTEMDAKLEVADEEVRALFESIEAMCDTARKKAREGVITREQQKSLKAQREKNMAEIRGLVLVSAKAIQKKATETGDPLDESDEDVKALCENVKKLWDEVRSEGRESIMDEGTRSGLVAKREEINIDVKYPQLEAEKYKDIKQKMLKYLDYELHERTLEPDPVEKRTSALLDQLLDLKGKNEQQAGTIEDLASGSVDQGSVEGVLVLAIEIVEKILKEKTVLQRERDVLTDNLAALCTLPQDSADFKEAMRVIRDDFLHKGLIREGEIPQSPGLVGGFSPLRSPGSAVGGMGR